MGKTEQVKAALSEDGDLVHARFHSVRTGPQEVYERDWVTPLWFAAMNGRTDIVGLLLEHGADPQVADAQGRSILDYARDAGQDQIVEMLEA